ncbi:unnamed protein product [Agarophyton chilense]
MPTVRQRRRQKASPATTNATSTSSAPVEPATASDSTKRLKSLLLTATSVVGPVAAGLIAAASFRNNSVAVAVFAISVVAMLGALFLVFFSILRQKDQTLIPLPKIYSADGTATEIPKLTVFDHDNKVATQLSSQLPAFALAAVWFCLWTGYMPFFLVFTSFFLHRLFYHPLFRIHLWHETDHSDLLRPFGAAPIFKETPDAGVKVIAGREQFQQLLKSVNKDALVVLDCSASWCAPCRAMAPQVIKLSEQFKNCVFATIDVDVSQDIASDLQVTGIPSFYFYRDEALLQSEIGPSPKKLRQVIESHL